LLSSLPIYAVETLTLDSQHTYILWHINHFGFSTQTGKWYTSGTLIIDKDKPQRQVYNDFITADGERLKLYSPHAQLATRVSSRMLAGNATEVALDISQAGMTFEAGDRAAVLPQNSETEVDSILKKYKLVADDKIVLNLEWRKFLSREWNVDLTSMEIKKLLRYADLDGLNNTNVKMDLTIDHLTPLKTRLYSISPMPESKFQDIIRLTVGSHSYSDTSGILHEGIASSYLIKGDAPVRITKAPARYFHLPKNSQIPILMFAAGTGISPFMGFINVRKLENPSAKNWLFYSVQDSQSFYHAEELENALRDETLDLSVIFSRAKDYDTVIFDKSTNRLKQGKRYKGKHVDELIKENADAISELIVQHNAYIYICGNTGFAGAVRKSLDTALQKNIANDNERRDYIDSLIANHRYNSDIFTPAGRDTNQSYKQILRSEVSYHNKLNDCWVILNGSVYDMTKFMHIHPGGRKIIQVSGGLNGSADYNHIRHNMDPQIEALLGQYKLGVLSQPTFNSPANTRLYNTSVSFLEALLEMENTLSNNTLLSTSKSPYLWRETYSVVIEGRLASYDAIGGVGSFKFVFGTMLKDLYDAVHYPIAKLDNIYDELVITTSACALYIRQASLGKLPENELSILENIFKSIIEATLKFIGKVKSNVVNLIKEMENKQDDIDITVLQTNIRGVEQCMNEYALVIKHVHTALKLSSNIDEQLQNGDLRNSLGGGVCPLGFTIESVAKQKPISSTAKMAEILTGARQQECIPTSSAPNYIKPVVIAGAVIGGALIGYGLVRRLFGSGAATQLNKDAVETLSNRCAKGFGY